MFQMILQMIYNDDILYYIEDDDDNINDDNCSNEYNNDHMTLT